MKSPLSHHHHNSKTIWLSLKRETGYTLLEILLVLFCVSLVLSVTFPIFVARLNYSLYEQAVQKLYMTMYEAQYIAMEQGQRASIIMANGNVVTIKVDHVGVVSQWELPEGMKVDLRNVGHSITYTERGTISKVGTIKIETPLWAKEYSINFTFGRMREK